MPKKLINEQSSTDNSIGIERQAIYYHICPCHNLSYVFFIPALPLTNKSFSFCSSIVLLSLDLFPEESLIVRNRGFGMCFHWSKPGCFDPAKAHFAPDYYYVHKRRSLLKLFALLL